MSTHGLMAKGPPATPKFHFFLRIATLALSVACFIPACYNASVAGDIFTVNFDNTAPGALAIFACIWTWIVLALDIAFSLRLHSWYIRLVFFIGYILAIIFWLSTWALAARAAADVLECTFLECTRYGGSIAAVAALGAIIWVLLIVILIFWTLAALRRSPENTANSTELGAVKTEAGYGNNNHHNGVTGPAVGAAAATGIPYHDHHNQGYAPDNQVPNSQYVNHGAAAGQYPPQNYEHQQHGTPAPYSTTSSPAPQQPGYGQQPVGHHGQQAPPYPEQPIGYPQEPQQLPAQQYPQQGQHSAPYPQ